ncbi:MAG: fimbrial protein FimV, partial [Nitrosomonadaceae bacterium]
MRRSIIRVCLFLIALASPCAVHAVGLGKLTLNSYLGQPFKAEIDLVAVKKEEIPSLVASLASRDAFRLANVDYVPFLFTFEISIENRADGQSYVKIISPDPVVEPFLTMLVELNWSTGRLIREYTVLLDPPEEALRPTAPAMQVEPVVPSSVKSEPATAEQPDSIIEGSVSDEEPAVQEAAPIQEAAPVQEVAPVEKSDVIT